MPVIVTPDPLSAGAEAAGSYLNQSRVNKEQALAMQMERQKMANDEAYRQATMQQNEQHFQKQYDLQHQAEMAREQHEKIQDDIAQADEAFTRSLDDIHRSTAVADRDTAQARAKVAVVTAKYASQLEAAGLSKAQAEAHAAQVTSQFAAQHAQDEHAQAQASIASSQASAGLMGAETAEAQARTKALTNPQTSIPGVDANTAKMLDMDYRAQMTSWNRRNADFQRRQAANQLQPNEQAPPEPLSPMDFGAVLADSVDAVRKDPSQFNAMEQAITANQQLSPYQKRMALLQLAASVRGKNTTPKKKVVPPAPPPQVPGSLQDSLQAGMAAGG